MILKAYVIFDSIAQAFLQPQFFHNDGMAMRSLQAAVNAKEPNAINQRPQEFSLFYTGTFDDKTGLVQSEEVPKRIVLASELVENDRPKYTDVDMEKIMQEIMELKKEFKNVPALMKKQAE